MILKRSMCIFLFVCFTVSGCFVSRDQEPEGGVAAFSSWVQAHAARIEDRTEAEWQQAREDFRFRTEVLDQKLGELSREDVQAYKQHKERFERLDAEFEQLAEKRKLLAPWKEDLLGSYADMAVVNEGNVAEVYRFFLLNVREKHVEWNENAWRMATLVLQDLNKRKSRLDAELPSEDEVKIKALQMEFAAIEAAGETEN